jgi:hypothetical protein
VAEGFRLFVREVLLYGGAGFVEPVVGGISLMSGMSSSMAYRQVDVDTRPAGSRDSSRENFGQFIQNYRWPSGRSGRASAWPWKARKSLSLVPESLEEPQPGVIWKALTKLSQSSLEGSEEARHGVYLEGSEEACHGVLWKARKSLIHGASGRIESRGPYMFPSCQLGRTELDLVARKYTARPGNAAASGFLIFPGFRDSGSVECRRSLVAGEDPDREDGEKGIEEGRQVERTLERSH